MHDWHALPNLVPSRHSVQGYKPLLLTDLSGLLGRYISKRAVWPLGAVLDAPSSIKDLGLVQRQEPVLVQAFVAEFSVEALDVSVVIDDVQALKPAAISQTVSHKIHRLVLIRAIAVVCVDIHNVV